MTRKISHGTPIQQAPDFLNIKEAAGLLSVSTATIRNWVKSGKIHAVSPGRSSAFDKEEILTLKNEIESGVSPRLKSRRNKRAVEGTFIPTEYVDSEDYIRLAQKILQITNDSPTQISPQLILLEVALSLFVKRGRLIIPPQFQKRSLSELVIEGSLSLGAWITLLHPLYDFSQELSEAQIKLLREIHRLEFPFIPGDDLLGLIYMTLSNLSYRKTKGSYYTPSTIVDSLVSKSLDSLSKVPLPKIVDPCCGSGNFLIKLFLVGRTQLLDQGLSLEEAETRLLQECLAGYDIDAVAVALAKINLGLLREAPTLLSIDDQIECRNALKYYEPAYAQDNPQYDLVIGNPPWGYSFTPNEISQFKEQFVTAQASLESFCLFLEYGLCLFKTNCNLSFFITEALLNVRLHTPIRKFLLETTEILNIEILGQQFSKVFSQTLTLMVRNSKTPSRHEHEIKVFLGDRVLSIPQQRFYENDMNIYNINASPLEYTIIDSMKSIPGVQFLKGNADFALGIVTGNNQECLLPQPSPDTEHILKGNDLFKYNFYPSENYIVFDPRKFQQVAPEKYYRAPEKLLYRFINQNLVFAYDDKGTLSLNSANIVIPHLPGYSIKYILALLNSRAAQFFFAISYSSIKVLRKHIESIPIPPCDLTEQQEIISLVDKLLNTQKNSLRIDLYEQIDTKIMELYNFNTGQINLIQKKLSQVTILLNKPPRKKD